MIKLVVRLAGTNVATGVGEELVRLQSNHNDPDHLDALISKCLEQALRGTDTETLKATKPMVGVELTIEGADADRPAFHLSKETISRMAEVGADLDFDPYLYP